MTRRIVFCHFVAHLPYADRLPKFFSAAGRISVFAACLLNCVLVALVLSHGLLCLQTWNWHQLDDAICSKVLNGRCLSVHGWKQNLLLPSVVDLDHHLLRHQYPLLVLHLQHPHREAGTKTGSLLHLLSAARCVQNGCTLQVMLASLLSWIVTPWPFASSVNATAVCPCSTMPKVIAPERGKGHCTPPLQ